MLTALRVLVSFAAKLILQRHLILNFVVRDLKSRYVGSLMGFFWSIVHPLVLLVSYTFVFSIVFRIRLVDAGTDNFPLFLFCGILPWLYFQDTVARSCTAVIDQANLIRKTIFPSEILPVSILLSNLVTHLTGFLILLLVVAALEEIHWPALLVPFYLLLLMLFALGLGWLLGALQVFLRDTIQILSVALVFWFWFTPVFYQVEVVPVSFQPWIRLNPLTHVVEGYRRLLLEGALPELESLLLLALQSLFMLMAGAWFFRSTKREFVDVL